MKAEKPNNVVPIRRASAERDEVSDEALLLAAGTGDASAIAVLFRRHHPTIYRALTRLLGPQAEVEDLVQATFLEAWRSAASFSGRSSAKTWLVGIAYNVYRHHVRALVRRRSAFRLFAIESATSETPMTEGRVDARRDLGTLERALLDLPEDLRAAFVLCQLEDLSGREAAQILKTRDGTVRRRVHEAKKRLLRATHPGSSK